MTEQELMKGPEHKSWGAELSNLNVTGVAISKEAGQEKLLKSAPSLTVTLVNILHNRPVTIAL